MSYKAFDEFADQAITMGRISLIAVLGGRYWPYCGSAFPLLLRYRSLEKPCGHLPIGGSGFGWLICLILPMGLMTWITMKEVGRSDQEQSKRSLCQRDLILNTICSIGLIFSALVFPCQEKRVVVPSTVVKLFRFLSYGLA